MMLLPTVKTVSNTFYVFSKQFEIEAPLRAIDSLCGH